jgi:hypothetical protein
VEHARAEIQLQAPVGGVTLRENLEQVVKSSGGKVIPPELTPPELPSAMEHLWLWFADLSRGRPHTGFGPGPIPYSEILAWAALTGQRPSPWEVAVLKRLDGVYLEVTAKFQTPPGGKNGPSDSRVRR